VVLRLENNLRTALLLVAIAVMAIVSTSKLFGQGVKPPKSKAWSFVFRVVDEDGAQLKDATVETKADDTSDSHQQLPNGDFQIEGYSTPNQLVLRCQSEGKSPIKVQWLNFYDIPDSSAAKPFLVTLPTAKAIGGKVVDRQGDAIEGATVFVWVPSAGQRLQLEISDFPCKTDAQGKWSCPVAPADLRRVRIRLQHPDYHSDQRYQAVKDVSIEDVQAHNHVAVMRKGATVNGKVTGPDGQPVANADVYQGTDRLGTERRKLCIHKLPERFDGADGGC